MPTVEHNVDSVGGAHNDIRQLRHPNVVRVMRLLVTGIRAATVIILLLLCGSALLVTASIAYSETSMPPDSMELHGWSVDWPRALAIGAAAATAVVTGLVLLWYVTRRIRLQSLFWSFTVYTFLCQLVWIVALRTDIFIYPDTMALDHLARALLSGDFTLFSGPAFSAEGHMDNYLAVYPHQAGGVLFFAFIYSVFGVGNLLGVQLVSALGVTAACASIVVITWVTFQKSSTTRWSVLLTATCLPLLLSSAFVYGNAAALGAVLVAVATSLLALRQKHILSGRGLLLTVISCVTLAAAIIIKNTSVLFLLPLALLWIIHLARKRQFWALAPAVIVAGLLSQVGALGVVMLEQWTSTDFGEGMPRTAWIAMGLSQYPMLGMPGWWGPDVYDYYIQAGGDTDRQSALAMNTILGRLSHFVSDPGYGYNFLTTKLGTEWLDPSFQSGYYSAMATYETQGPSPLMHILYDGYRSHAAYTFWTDGYQTALYGLSAIGVWTMVKRRLADTPGTHFLVLNLLCGLSVYTLWEAKSVYLLPYFVCLIPLASYGCSSVAGWLSKRLLPAWARAAPHADTPSGRHSKIDPFESSTTHD